MPEIIFAQTAREAVIWLERSRSLALRGATICFALLIMRCGDILDLFDNGVIEQVVEF